MFKSLVLASGLVALTVGSAHAADPVAEVMHDWTGPYVGLNAGYAWGNQVQSDDSGYDSGEHDINGFIGGGQIGANFQTGAFVLGAETDIQYANITGEFDDNKDWGCGPKSDGCSTDVDWFGTVRLRAGYAFDNFMPYVTGGLAYGSVKSQIEASGSDFRVSDTNIGWTLGGGMEMAFDEHFTGRLEYLYVDLGDTQSTGQYDFSGSAKFSTVRAAVNYAF